MIASQLQNTSGDPVLAHSSDAYHRGDMNIDEQKATYHAVYDMIKWCSLGTAALLTVPIVWFCTDLGPAAGFGLAIVEIGLGVLFLRDKNTSEGH